MLNNNAAGSRILRGVFLAVLLAVSGFASCGGGGGATTPNSPPPTVSLSAASASIAYNANTDITWSSTNSTSCTSSGSSGTGTAGSFNTGALTTTTVYAVRCDGPGGWDAKSVTVTVASSAVSSVITSFSNAGAGITTVLSENTLTNGFAITISGTTNYPGTYIVANRTPTSFTIVAPYVAAPPYVAGTGVWQLAGGMIPGCSTLGATGAITLSNAPSRFNGVAPLSVFFDATGTTATATTRPFHDLEYRWDFGDPLGSPANGTTWNTGSRAGVSSRNTATGPVAGHVFERPGIYTVALAATDGTNTVSNSCAQIVVQDPDAVFAGANTVCIGATSLPVQGVGGCPTGANTAQQSSFVTAINTYALTGKRVLFKRGDTFTAATTAAIIQTGPGIVGAFDTGATPVVQMTGNTTILNLSSRSTPGISDWRVMDLALDGLSNSASVGIDASGGINQVTLLRLNINNTHGGIIFSDSILDYQNSTVYSGHTMWDQLTIVDSSVLHTIGGAGANGISLAATRLSVLGNLFDDSIAAEHVMRIFNVGKGVISSNTLSRQASLKLALKLHAQTWCDIGSPVGTCVHILPNYTTDTPPIGVAGPYTEQVVISDNKFVSADSTDWTVNTGPQNAQSDERLRNIIVERNWFVAGSTTQVALVVNAADVTIRNNICNMTSVLGGKCVSVSLRGLTSPEPPPTNVRIYNNTFYSASAGDFTGISIAAPTANTTVYNNLGSAPFATVRTMVSDAGTGTAQGNNLLNNSPAALFVNATPSVPADFSLIPLPNPARDTGLSTVPVFSDFFRISRPQNGVIDIGATEQ